MRSVLLIFIAHTALNACSSSSDESGGAPQKQLLPNYANRSELPTCDKARDSEMVYVEDQTSIHICKNENWIAVQGQSVPNPVQEPASIPAENLPGVKIAQEGRAGRDGNNGTTLYVVGSDDKSVGLFGGMGSDGFNVFFSNSGFVRINPENGRIPDELAIGCKFESADCSGACLSVVGPSNSVGNVVVANALFVAKGAKKSGIIAKSSWNPRTNSCSGGLTSPLAAYFETAQIGGVKYPVPAPVAIQAR